MKKALFLTIPVEYPNRRFTQIKPIPQMISQAFICEIS